MNNKTLIYLYVAIVLWFCSNQFAVLYAQDNNKSVLSLKEAIDIAMKNNHHAKEAVASLPVTKASLIIAKYFPNPTIGANSEIVKGGSTHPVQLGQSIELGRKRHYRVEIAKEQISKAELEVAKVLWEIHTQVHIEYASLSVGQDMFKLAKERLEFYKTLADIAKKRYKAGDIAKIELDRAEMELLAAENKFDDLDGNLKKAEIDFNHILGNESDLSVNVKEALELKPFIMIENYQPLQMTVQEALTKRLEIAIIERDFGITRAQLKKAKWERIPNVYIEGGPAKPNYEANVWGPYLGTSFELPVFNRKQGEIAQAKASLDFLEKQKETIEHDIKIDVANSLRELEVRESQIYRFQEKLLNQSQNILGLIQEGYKKGKLNLTDVLQAEQKNRDLRQEYLSSLLNYQIALATLEYAVGVPLYGLTEKQ